MDDWEGGSPIMEIPGCSILVLKNNPDLSILWTIVSSNDRWFPFLFAWLGIIFKEEDDSIWIFINQVQVIWFMRK